MRHLLYICLMLAGLALGAVMCNQFKDSLAAFTWDTAPCFIEESKVVYSEHADTYCSHTLRYSYEVSGTPFIGTTWRLDPGEPLSWCSSLASLAGNTPTGTTTTCYVDPNNPQRAVLDQGNIFSLLGLLVPLLIFIAGALGLRSLTAPSPMINAARIKIICRVVATIAFIVSTVGGIYTGIVPILEILSARNWAEHECTVLTNSLKTFESSMHSKQRGYQIQIVYSYEIEQQRYVSDRFDFVKWGTGDANALAAITNTYPIDARVGCFIDTGNPYEAVLDRTYGTKYLLGFFPFIFSFASLVLLQVTRKLM